jgi:small subunit ribosomal protein S4
MLKSDPAKENSAKRKDPPGPQTRRMRQLSEYGVQLREKQKVKRIYGVLEKQFRKYYKEATRIPGITGEELLAILERRLDNVVYRLGMGSTRAQARQFVNHGHIWVNGKQVDICSYQVKVGDVIEFAEKSKDRGFMKENIDDNTADYIQPWIEYDPAAKKGTVVALPRREHVEYPINEQLIIELYSK